MQRDEHQLQLPHTHAHAHKHAHEPAQHLPRHPDVGFLSVLYSVGDHPLQIWDKRVCNGHLKRVHDDEIESSAIELVGDTVSTAYIVCPRDPAHSLSVRFPVLALIIKTDRARHFTFEITVLDDQHVSRRFRISNFQREARVKPFLCTLPMNWADGWNQVHFDLAELTQRVYHTKYIETTRVQIHANCRIRRIYFTDRAYEEFEHPPEFKLFLPFQFSQMAT